MKTLGPSLKRPQKQKVKRDWKKLKLNLPETTKLPTSLPAYSASDVFEANPLQSKKILFKLPEAVPETTEETPDPVRASDMDTSEIGNTDYSLPYLVSNSAHPVTGTYNMLIVSPAEG